MGPLELFSGPVLSFPSAPGQNIVGNFWNKKIKKSQHTTTSVEY